MLLVPRPAAAQRGVDSAQLRQLVEAQMRRSRLPAVAVAIVGPEGEIWSAGFSRDGQPITPDTPFLIGSVTKTITALAAAQLADSGRLRFDDLVIHHLPMFPVEGITLRHLLTHTSGFRQWSGHDRRAQREGTFGHVSAARRPGEAFEYSSLNYIILGRVIEAASGAPYGEYVRRHIFEPLGMRNSFTVLDSARAHGLVRGRRYLFGLTLAGDEVQQPAPLVPAGFVASTARDLGRYLAMLLNQGRAGDHQIVSPEAVRALFTPWNGDSTGAGMSWGIGNTRIGHAGSTPTFSARLALLPAERLGVVVLANVNSGPFFSGTGAVMEGVIASLRGAAASPARPDEILFKVVLLALVIAGVVRLGVRLRRWAALGFPRRLTPSRRVVMPLVVEAAGTAVVLVAIPRWIGVPLRTILEYFPDLGLAMMVGVAAGIPGALLLAFMRAGAPPLR